MFTMSTSLKIAFGVALVVSAMIFGCAAKAEGGDYHGNMTPVLFEWSATQELENYISVRAGRVHSDGETTYVAHVGQGLGLLFELPMMTESELHSLLAYIRKAAKPTDGIDLRYISLKGEHGEIEVNVTSQTDSLLMTALTGAIAAIEELKKVPSEVRL